MPRLSIALRNKAAIGNRGGTSKTALSVAGPICVIGVGMTSTLRGDSIRGRNRSRRCDLREFADVLFGRRLSSSRPVVNGVSPEILDVTPFVFLGDAHDLASLRSPSATLLFERTLAD